MQWQTVQHALPQQLPRLAWLVVQAGVQVRLQQAEQALRERPVAEVLQPLQHAVQQPHRQHEWAIQAPLLLPLASG